MRATYKYFKGFDAKGAPQYAAYSCSTTLIPKSPAGADDFVGVAPIFLAPVAATGFPGFCAELNYPFSGREISVPDRLADVP